MSNRKYFDAIRYADKSFSSTRQEMQGESMESETVKQKYQRKFWHMKKIRELLTIYLRLQSVSEKGQRYICQRLFFFISSWYKQPFQ